MQNVGFLMTWLISSCFHPGKACNQFEVSCAIIMLSFTSVRDNVLNRCNNLLICSCLNRQVLQTFRIIMQSDSLVNLISYFVIEKNYFLRVSFKSKWLV